MRTTLKVVLLILVAGVLVGVGYALLQISGRLSDDFTELPTVRDQGKNTGTVHIGNTLVIVEVVDTPRARAQGLSGRTSLSRGTGMLFVFDEPGEYGFWMKDMKFSIDIIWLDHEGNVVTIHERVSPESYPRTYYPTELARYVLEVPAGFSEQHGVHEETVAQIGLQ